MEAHCPVDASSATHDVTGALARRLTNGAMVALLTAISIVLLSIHSLTFVASAALFSLLAAAGFLVVVLDEAERWLLSRARLQRARRHAAFAGVVALPAGVGFYLYAEVHTELLWWTGLALGAPVVAAASCLKWRKELVDFPLLWSVVLVALLYWVHVHEGTLVSIRPGTGHLHTVLYVGLWLGTAGLLRATTSRLTARDSLLAIGALLMLGVCLHEADRNVLSDLYAAVHASLGGAAFLLLYSGFTAATLRLRASGRQRRFPRLQRATTVALALAAFAALFVGQLSPGSRASLAQAPFGATLLDFLPHASGGPRSKDHPALQYDQYLEGGSPTGHNILLVTVDALRADAIEYAPNLQALAKESLHFRRAYSQGSRTSIGMSALMTGRYSANLRWELWRYSRGRIYDPAATSEEQMARLGQRFVYTTMPITPPGEMLAERLAAAGYTTLAVPYAGGNHFFKKGAGFDRGFETFVDLTKKKWKTPTSLRITKTAAKIIPTNQSRPWFLWVHYYDPHQAGRFKSRYERLTREFDSAFGQLLQQLRLKGEYDNTIIGVTGDHGEAFGEHNRHGHGSTLYDEQVLVPLVLRIPGVAPESHDIPVANVDLTATLLLLSGAETKNIDGVNLTAAKAHIDSFRKRPVFTELHRYLSNQGKRTSDLKAVIRDDMKLIMDRRRNTVKLYDFVEDPGESNNLVNREPERFNELEDILMAFLATEQSTGTLP